MWLAEPVAVRPVDRGDVDEGVSGTLHSAETCGEFGSTQTYASADLRTACAVRAAVRTACVRCGQACAFVLCWGVRVSPAREGRQVYVVIV